MGTKPRKVARPAAKAPTKSAKAPKAQAPKAPVAAKGKKKPADPCASCPKCLYFVIHDTAGGNATQTAETARNNPGSWAKAHAYLFMDGTHYQSLPWAQKRRATKRERTRGLPGTMVHVECVQPGQDENVHWTPAQYTMLAALFVDATKAIRKANRMDPSNNDWLIIVPHIEMDRGLADGHRDPRFFDYNQYYEALRGMGVPIDSLKRFEHDRYWGGQVVTHQARRDPRQSPDSLLPRPKYYMPLASDANNFPPILTGPPR